MTDSWKRGCASPVCISKTSHKPGWQHDLRDHWLLVSAGFCSGFVSASLDEFLTDETRVAAVLLATDAATSPVFPAVRNGQCRDEIIQPRST